MSLRFRLNLLITALLLLFMVAVGYVIINGTKASIQEGVESATRVTTQLLDTVIISSVQNPDWGYTHDVLKLFLQSLGHVRSNEIRLYSLQGTLLYQSPPSKYRAHENPPQWFVDLLDPHEKSVARLVRFGRLEIIPNPSGAIREAWSKVSYLFWLGLTFFILVNGMVYWMLGRSLRPLGAMLKAINQVEQGDLTARLPEFALPEFARIGHNFNAMGASLQASTAENQRLALIAQQTADAMIIHDLNGNISFWNLAAERLFGYTPLEIMGRSVNLLSPEDLAGDLERNLTVITAGQSIDNQITQRISKSGKILDVSISVAPLVDPKTNQVIGDICSMRDITERKKAEEAMRRLEENRQLTHVIQKHIEDERRSLARELHDELGQYVTAIKTFAVGIANKAKAHRADPGMSDIAANAQVIVSAANQIYDGMHNIVRQLRPGSLDNLGLAETLKDVVSIYQAQNPNIKINLQLKGDLHGLGETVSINLYRIVQESLNNALKYAGATMIDIQLTKTKMGELQLSIKDNGIGMDVDSIDQTKQFGLLGMRERVQALHGSFNVDAAPGLGTAIYINIPNHPLSQ